MRNIKTLRKNLKYNKKKRTKKKLVKGGTLNLNENDPLKEFEYPLNKIRLLDCHGSLTGETFTLPRGYCVITCVNTNKLNMFTSEIFNFLEDIEYDINKMFHLDRDFSNYEGQIIGPERYTEKTIINLSKINRSVKIGLKKEKYDTDSHLFSFYEFRIHVGPIELNNACLEFFDFENSKHNEIGGLYFHNKGVGEKCEKPFNTYDFKETYSLNHLIDSYKPTTLLVTNCRMVEVPVGIQREKQLEILTALRITSNFHSGFRNKIRETCDESSCENKGTYRCPMCHSIKFNLCDEHVRHTREFFFGNIKYTNLAKELGVHFEYCELKCGYQGQGEKCFKTGIINYSLHDKTEVRLLCMEHYSKGFLPIEDYKQELETKLKNEELKKIYNSILLLNVKAENKYAEIVEKHKNEPLSVMESKYPFDRNLNHIKEGEYVAQFIILNIEEISLENAVIYLTGILKIIHYLILNLIAEMDPSDFESVCIIEDKNNELMDELQSIQFEITEKFNVFNKQNYF